MKLQRVKTSSSGCFLLTLAYKKDKIWRKLMQMQCDVCTKENLVTKS